MFMPVRSGFRVRCVASPWTLLVDLLMHATLSLPVAAQVPLPSGTAEAHDFVEVPPLGVPQRRPQRLFGTNCPGPTTPWSYQWLFDLPTGAPARVKAIAMRRADRPGTPALAAPAFTVTAQMWMGHSRVRAAEVSYLYATHRAADYRQVMSERVVSFPSVQWRSDGDYPFSYRLPLTSPFALGLGNSALVELRVSATTLCLNQIHPTLGYLDSWVAALPPGFVYYPAAPFGVGCAPAGGPVPDIIAINSVVTIGQRGAWIHWLTGNDYTSSLTVFAVGSSSQSWGGTNLPLSLDAYGAPGCSLYNSIDWTVPLLNPTAQFKTCAVAVPMDPGLVGMPLYVQGLRLHPAFNAMGLITTNALQLRIQGFADSWMATSMWTDPSAFGSGVPSGGGPTGPVLMLDGR